MDQQPTISWDLIKSVLQFIFAGIMAAGAWWCKTMAADIKELQSNNHKTHIELTTITSSTGAREKLQDERWKNLMSGMERLQNHLDALLQSKITDLAHKERQDRE